MLSGLSTILTGYFHIITFSYQSATAAHGERTLHQGDGLGDSSHHSGHHLGLLGHCDCTRLVHSDDRSSGGGRGCSSCAHLGCSSLQHPGRWVADLEAQHYFNIRAVSEKMNTTEMKTVDTMTGEATLTVVVPGETATVLRMVAPAGTLRTVPAAEGGIFCVAAAAAAKAAIPLI